MSIPANDAACKTKLRVWFLLTGFIFFCGSYWAALHSAHAQSSSQSSASAQAQLAPKLKAVVNAAPAKLAASHSATDSPGGPAWPQLTPVQQQALGPLQSKWESISEPQKRKWLAFVPNYLFRSTAEQAKLQSRMTEWASLSVQARTQARLNFAEAGSLTSEEKKAKWEAYQALSAEQKQKLQPGTPVKPAGATTTVKPVPQQKLANVVAAKPRPALTRPDTPNASAAPSVAGTAPAAAALVNPAAVSAAPLADAVAPSASPLPAAPALAAGALPAASAPAH